MAEEFSAVRRWFRVCLAGYSHMRGSRVKSPVTLYITAVSRDDRDNRLTKIRWDANKEKAFRFSKFSALEVAKQLCGPSWRRQAFVEDEDGKRVEPLPPTQKEVEAQKLSEQFNKEAKKVFDDILLGFRSSIHRRR